MKYSSQLQCGRRVFGAFVLPVFLLISGSLFAQSFRGSIRGKVTDPNGGLVTAAKVSTRNVNTGLTRDAATNEEGTFIVAELPAGTYTVTVSATGFAEVAQTVVVEI